MTPARYIPKPFLKSVPKARVVELWNSISEADMTLDETLAEFARLIIEEASR